LYKVHKINVKRGVFSVHLHVSSPKLTFIEQ
jgi:hypothetical protein